MRMKAIHASMILRCWPVDVVIVRDPSLMCASIAIQDPEGGGEKGGGGGAKLSR